MDERADEYVLFADRLIDGTGKEPLEGFGVQVKAGRIEGIVRRDHKGLGKRMPVVERPGCTVLPGLIDAHVHLAGGRTDVEHQELGCILEHEIPRGMRGAAQARQLLRWGFTSVRDISWNGLYLKRIFAEGILSGPRIVACGPGLSRSGGHGDLFQLPRDFVQDHHFWTYLADGEDEIRKAVRMILRQGADQIKLWISGGGNCETDRDTDTHYSREEVAAAVAEAKMVGGTMVCAHCENRESVAIAVAAGVDTIEHGENMSEETAREMARRGVILVPTLALLLSWMTDFSSPGVRASGKKRTNAFFQRDYLAAQRESEGSPPDGAAEQARIRENLAMARAAGVKIALGSDTVFEPLTEYGPYSVRELVTLVDCGLTPLQAIHSATQIAAEALGLSRWIGTLERGKAADILVVSGNPLEDIRVFADADNLRMIVQGGRVVMEDGTAPWPA